MTAPASSEPTELSRFREHRQHPGAKGDAAADAKDPKHKQTIIALAAIAGVILAYLTYKKAKAGTPAATPSLGSGSVAGSGTTDTSSTGTLASYASILAGLQNQITNLAGGVGNTAQSTADQPLAYASQIYAPLTGDNVVAVERIGDKTSSRYGLIVEALKDGSLFGFTASQWATATKADPSLGGKVVNVSDITAPVYSTAGNIAAAPVNQVQAKLPTLVPPGTGTNPPVS